MRPSVGSRLTSWIIPALASATLLAEQPVPAPPGRMVDLGGHRLHVHCTGEGGPTVVVENGLGDFSFDWMLVQKRVSEFTRICTYDRAGYAWSDPGPKPRTFAQLNLELRDALQKLGEEGPFVLVGHSFGGPVARQFALTYPRDVAGLVLVDSASENQRIRIPGRAIWLYDGARGRTIPPPRDELGPQDRPPTPAPSPPGPARELDPDYRILPADAQRLQRWAESLAAIEDAEDSQREWSTEYFARWHASPQDGSLGALPLLVLTRRHGGYGDDLDVPARELEKERRDAQAALARLSRKGELRILATGHQMQLEAPDAVAKAIRRVVEAVRGGRASSASAKKARPPRSEGVRSRAGSAAPYFFAARN